VSVKFAKYSSQRARAPKSAWSNCVGNKEKKDEFFEVNKWANF